MVLSLNIRCASSAVEVSPSLDAAVIERVVCAKTGISSSIMRRVHLSSAVFWSDLFFDDTIIPILLIRSGKTAIAESQLSAQDEIAFSLSVLT